MKTGKRYISTLSFGLSCALIASVIATPTPQAWAKAPALSRAPAKAKLTKKSRPATVSKKPRPGPLQCFGKGIETYGHALVLSPKLKKPIQMSDRKKLWILGGQDPVQLTQLESLFPEISNQYILDIKLDEKSAASSFQSLKNYATHGVFTSAVKLRAATVVDKNEKFSTTHEIEKLVSQLNEVDLKENVANIKHKWTSSRDEDEIVVFQMELDNKTILAAIQLHDGTSDCLTLDLDAHRPILAEGVDPNVIPENYLFNLPLAPPFEISYFYGPRIFNSMNVSIGMERRPTPEPKSLISHSNKSVEYLNKYWQFHSGIDFSVMSGTPVYAPYDGHVFAMGKMGCAGNTLVVAHTVSGADNLIFSVYEHLMDPKNFAKVVVKNGGVVRPYRPGDKLGPGERTRALQIGDPVYQGSFLAKSGASGSKIGFSKGFKEGCVAGAHLHFELRVPKASSAEAAKEFSSENKRKNPLDMGMRFRFVELETVAINPADFIYGLDMLCRTRKDLEIKNASALRKDDPKAVPPITAGLCSLKYEASLKRVPPIYKLTRQKDGVEPPVSARNPASRNLL